MTIDGISPLRISTIGIPIAASKPDLAINPPQIQSPDIPEGLKYLFSNFVGQRLQAELTRSQVQKALVKRQKRSHIQQRHWVAYLFGEEGQHKQNHQDDEQAQAEYFCDSLQQGNINDCFLIAVFYAVMRNPRYGKVGLAKLIEPIEFFQPVHDPQGKVSFALHTYYEVRFPGFPDIPLIINPREINQAEQVKGGIGYRILERAFAHLSQKLSLCQEESSQHLDSVLLSINGGGQPAVTLYSLTAHQPCLLSKCIDLPDNHLKEKLSQFFSKVKQEPDRYMVIAVTDGPKAGYQDPEKRFCNWHVFTVEICRRSQQIVVVDPHNTKAHRHPVSIDELAAFFSDFVMVEIPTCQTHSIGRMP